MTNLIKVEAFCFAIAMSVLWHIKEMSCTEDFYTATKCVYGAIPMYKMSYRRVTDSTSLMKLNEIGIYTLGVCVSKLFSLRPVDMRHQIRH